MVLGKGAKMEFKIVRANCDKCGKKLYKYNYSYVDGNRVRYFFGLLNIYTFTEGRCRECDPDEDDCAISVSGRRCGGMSECGSSFTGSGNNG